jgi:hypothetical protein
LAYRALLGEAQHDAAVSDLVRDADVLGHASNVVLGRVRPKAPSMPEAHLAAAQLAGPFVLLILETGRPVPKTMLVEHAETLLSAWSTEP